MDGTLDRDHEISMPTKLTQLRYSGYSAEFLDRVEPNGNIPGKNGTSIAGIFFQVLRLIYSVKPAFVNLVCND